MIVDHWNSRVTNGDIVYVLGDISMRGKSEDLVLSHYPLFSWNKMGRGSILLYGHTHDSAEDAYFQKCLLEMQVHDCRHVYDKKLLAINVGCMKKYMDYTPRTLKELLSF